MDGPAGSFPLAAAVSAALAPRLGPDGSIVASGLATTLLAPLRVFRRVVHKA